MGLESMGIPNRIWDPLVHLLKFRPGEQQLIDFPVSRLLGGLCEKRVAMSKHPG